MQYGEEKEAKADAYHWYYHDVCSIGILSFYGYRKISRELYLRKLLNDNINFEIPRLNIKVPVLEGTGSKQLQVSAGHFEGTGALGKGNFCICGHNSTIYAEIFNDLDQIQIGDEMYLVDNDANRTKYLYIVTEYKTVEPNHIVMTKCMTMQKKPEYSGFSATRISEKLLKK